MVRRCNAVATLVAAMQRSTALGLVFSKKGIHAIMVHWAAAAGRSSSRHSYSSEHHADHTGPVCEGGKHSGNGGRGGSTVRVHSQNVRGLKHLLRLEAVVDCMELAGVKPDHKTAYIMIRTAVNVVATDKVAEYELRFRELGVRSKPCADKLLTEVGVRTSVDDDDADDSCDDQAVHADAQAADSDEQQQHEQLQHYHYEQQHHNEQ